MITKILDLLWVLFHPTFWRQNYPFDPKVDSLLKEIMLKNPEIEEDTFFKLKFKDFPTIWVYNYPYAFGTIHKPFRTLGDEKSRGMASRKTRYKFNNFLNKKFKEIKY